MYILTSITSNYFKCSIVCVKSLLFVSLAKFPRGDEGFEYAMDHVWGDTIQVYLSSRKHLGFLSK